MTPDQLAAQLNADSFDIYLRAMLGDISIDAAIIAQEEAPVGEREIETGPLREVSHEPGRLKASLEPFIDDGAMRGGVTTDVPYARFVEEGTAAHIIVPRHQAANGGPGYLAFYLGGVGATVFAREVHHPGTAPDPFLERTLDKIQPRIGELSAQAGAAFFGSIR